ncbi:MAG: phosphoribosyltransferase family protein [Bacteroidota bacterium]|nr:phosphoribosyltransferase family protein [Bacteroidota bacterium]|tara:strand:- start:40 stop:537 length:498 start_codon:yes stop_codon:yes gene_type:complete
MRENKILNKEEIQDKIKRISYEIYEENFESKSLIICGIEKNGSEIARKVIKELKSICNIKIEFISISLNKKNPLNSIKIESSKNKIKDKPIILIDDVSNTGKTLIHVIKELIEFEPKKINTAVLVNRDHSLFPIKINFIGLSLSTSINNHIEVVLNENDIGAYLT